MVNHQLQFHATQISTTDLNGVFFRKPNKESVVNWRGTTGNGSSSRGRRPSSLPSGNGCRTHRATA